MRGPEKWPLDWWKHLRQGMWWRWHGTSAVPASRCQGACWYWGIPVAVPSVARPASRDLRLESSLRSCAFLARCVALLIGSVLLCGPPTVQARVTGDTDDTVVVTKHISGQLSVIRPHYLAVEYKQDADKHIGYEMAFPIDENVEFYGSKRSLDELEVGDTVRVTYEERTWTTEAGQERMERRAKAVKLVKSAVKGLRSGQ